jgi:hypothetical protein
MDTLAGRIALAEDKREVVIHKTEYGVIVHLPESTELGGIDIPESITREQLR